MGAKKIYKAKKVSNQPVVTAVEIEPEVVVAEEVHEEEDITVTDNAKEEVAPGEKRGTKRALEAPHGLPVSGRVWKKREIERYK